MISMDDLAEARNIICVHLPARQGRVLLDTTVSYTTSSIIKLSKTTVKTAENH